MVNKAGRRKYLEVDFRTIKFRKKQSLQLFDGKILIFPGLHAEICHENACFGYDET